MKILVYNKVQRGMSYEKACAELEQEINQIIANDVKFEEKEKKEANKKVQKKNLMRSLKK